MKKILISAVVIIAFVGYFWFQKQSLLAIDIVPSVSPTPTRTPTPVTDPTLPTARPTPTPTPQVSGFKNGTYTSQVGDVGYGPLQFEVVIQNGKITDIQFLQYPSDARHSQQVSNYALPILKQEAIQSQSANVDIVSGATATSEAFAQVLNALLSGIKV